MQRLVTTTIAMAATAVAIFTISGSATTATVDRSAPDNSMLMAASTQGACDGQGHWRIVMRPARADNQSLRAAVILRGLDPGSRVAGGVTLKNKGSVLVLDLGGRVKADGTFRVPVGARETGAHRLSFSTVVDGVVCRGRMSSITR